jgi:amidase
MAFQGKAEDIGYTPAVELARMIREKEISPVEVVDLFIERIERINPKVSLV